MGRIIKRVSRFAPEVHKREPTFHSVKCCRKAQWHPAARTVSAMLLGWGAASVPMQSYFASKMAFTSMPSSTARSCSTEPLSSCESHPSNVPRADRPRA